MRRLFCLRAVGRSVVPAVMLATLLLAGGPVAGSQGLPVSTRVAQVATAPAFSGSAAKQQVDALAGQIGSRPAGSANDARAVAYATEQLRQWGYQPTLQTFPVETYDDRGSRLEVTSSNGLQLAADTLTYSVAGQIDAPLVAAGLGQVTDFAGLDVRGKVALMQRGALRFSDKVANAAAAGASAAIVFNDTPGAVQGSLAHPEAIPAVTVSGEAGQRLRDLLGTAGVMVRLTVDASSARQTGTNVVAELPGSRANTGTVVFGAHLDTVPAGPGANDNGSGSGVVIELAHTLAQVDTTHRPYTLRFVLFGAEELGLYGSRDYVHTLSEEDRRAIVAMINLDMVGVGDAWRFGGSDDLVQRALGAATDLGVRSLPLRGPLAGASDHASFLDAGIPAVFVYRVEDPNYHTAGDRPELVDADALGQAGTIALRVLESLEAPDRLPSP